jgi:hypothetical protein
MAVTAIFAALYIAWQATGIGGATHNSLINNAVFIPFLLAGVVFAVRAAVFAGDPRTRGAWLLIAVAYACTGLGNLIWLVFESAPASPH